MDDDEIIETIHPNVIIHVDFDYYYAQVEEVLNPDLRDKPLGIKQRFHIVTSNYKAREYGIKKMDLISDALKKCPRLIIINGEDLSNYKTYSKRIAELLHAAIGPSERMGLDEHFLDITKLVEEQISKMNAEELRNLHMVGPFYPSEEAFTECKCGCQQRLMLGSQIAKDIREKILQDLKLTCSVGIAHNKLLAKLVGQCNKPNNQTTLAPTAASSFMASLSDLRSIMGIGGKTASRIEELGITSITELQNCEHDKLRKIFCAETATRLKEMSHGHDSTEVKPSEKPKTVGLEDSFKPTSKRSEVIEVFTDLLPRLVFQIQDDGRIPQSLRVTVRKFDVVKKISSRETRQCALFPSYFRYIEDEIKLADGADDRIMKNVMTLFDQLVGVKQKFYVNLLGLCFCKFQEQKKGLGSISSFLVKNDCDNFAEDKKHEAATTTDHHQEGEPSSKRQKTEDCNIDKPSPELPSNIDPTVWRELPLEMQQELMRSWQPNLKQTDSKSVTSQLKSKAMKMKNNSLLNHFVKK